MPQEPILRGPIQRRSQTNLPPSLVTCPLLRSRSTLPPLRARRFREGQDYDAIGGKRIAVNKRRGFDVFVGEDSGNPLLPESALTSLTFQKGKFHKHSVRFRLAAL
jgi:hypothetical protein